MKTQLPITLLLFIVSVVASAQQTGVKINPATGLPDDGTPLPKIDPATGLRHSESYDEWQKAKALMTLGQYEDSLNAFRNYFERSRFDQDQAGMRLFSIMDWVELGRRYPKARKALIELRDNDANELLSGDGDFIYFGEVQVINFDLDHGETSNTCALFKTIEQRDPQLAGQCYAFVEDQLVQRGEYATCRKYMGDPESGFQNDCDRYHMDMENQARMAEMQKKAQERMQEFYREHPDIPPPPDYSQRNEEMVKGRFVGRVRTEIEILVGTGDIDEAEKIQKEALAVLDDPRLESAVDDAKAKVAKTP